MSVSEFRDDQNSVDYDLLERQATSLLKDERNFIANAANFAAFVYDSLPAVNWAGFYFPDEGDLVLGPFAGRPACTRLPQGKGVCGAAFSAGETIVVDDVNAFAGHIVCDSHSRSEIVVPLIEDGQVAGVFDVDSPLPGRFGAADKAGLERLAIVFAQHTPLPQRHASPSPTRTHLNERIDIQTCRDHHVVLRYLLEELGKPEVSPEATLGLLKRLRTVLLAHLKLEDDWLYPHLQRAANDVVRRKAQTYSRDMGDLKENFLTLWETWTRPGEIARNRAVWRSDWNIFTKALIERMDREDHDLYVAAEASLDA